MSEKITQINSIIESICADYEGQIAYLKSSISAIDQVETYLSAVGISFVDLAAQLGYAVIKVEGEEMPVVVDPEPVQDSTEPAKDSAPTDAKKYTETELQAMTKQEIVDLITALDSNYSVSITNVSKDDLILDYLAKIA